MTVAAAVAAPWRHRAYVYKALAFIVFVLIALQYLLSGVIDRRSIETIFSINTSRSVCYDVFLYLLFLLVDLERLLASRTMSMKIAEIRYFSTFLL